MVSDSILIIEDDIQLSFFVKTILEREGYDVCSFYNGYEGLKGAVNNIYSLIILDMNLPDTNGINICKKIREFTDTPVIMFTAQNQVHEKVEALDAGANDYIIKPVEVPELLARVRAHLRLSFLKKDNDENQLSFKDLKVSNHTREIIRKNISVHLSPKEFEILLFFIRNPHKIITKKQIFEEVWNYTYNNVSDKRIIDEHINKLKKKIHIPEFPKLLHTLYGVGYILK